ncbi:MAG: Signal transduction histidine-protein kinase BarA [Stenotrophomonas maltophilia]|uniref:histidine kinase n=1 Tax=Stenotrophomonas maltophilia TaxID=40324 RepID=A0A7V8FGI4_STEMA|nr:MAG: Signal transduction histidine-protein kinase BarA [Stenotrophomonas maltophilia]
MPLALWLGLSGLLLVALALAGWRLHVRGRQLADANRAAATMARERDALAAERDTLHRTTERQGQLEQQLLQAKQVAEAAALAKGEFLATMSHEIRTPLNGILPMLDLVARGPLRDDQRQLLATASSSSQQLLRIVDDILDYSRLEAQALELEITSFNLRDLLDGVVQLLQRAAEAKGLRLHLLLDPGVRLAVRGDPVRLRQVLDNLLANAIKFTAQGQVQLRVQRLGEGPAHHQLRIEISDTGIGIEPALQARLFQSFSQADASTTRVYGGTGLGLAICRRIIDLMRGQNGVQSTPGDGATFWFEIPLLKVPGDLAALPRLPGRLLMLSADAALAARVQRVAEHHNLQVQRMDLLPELLPQLRGTPAPGHGHLAWLLLDARQLPHGADSVHRALASREGEPLPVLWLHAAPSMALPGQPCWPDDGSDAALHALLAAPAARPRVAADAPSPPPAQWPSLGLRVLLAEDNAVNRAVAERLLAVLGCHVQIAPDGAQALAALHRGGIDVVLMDCQMPVLDGYAASRQWRAHEADAGLPRLPIIAITANAMAGDRERCLQAGMDDYLSKPIPIAGLHALLVRHAGSRHAPPLAAVPGIVPAPTPLQTCAPAPVKLPVLDHAVLQELHGTVGEATPRIIGLFLDDTPGLVQQLQQAALAQDNAQLGALAHSLKSASANVGAVALAAVARRIEDEARRPGAQLPAVAVALLVAEFARARVALAGAMARQPDHGSA